MAMIDVRFEPLPADKFTFEHTYLRMRDANTPSASTTYSYLDSSGSTTASQISRKTNTSETQIDIRSTTIKNPHSASIRLEENSGHANCKTGEDSHIHTHNPQKNSAQQRPTANTPIIDLIVGDPDEIYPLASVTKPIAAYAVLVAAERGLINLDEPAGPEGSTIRHLLAHASGLPFGAGIAISRPGTRRVYSNYGFDVLGDAVSARLGMPIQEWIQTAVAEPLSMDTFAIQAGRWIVQDSSASSHAGSKDSIVESSNSHATSTHHSASNDEASTRISIRHSIKPVQATWSGSIAADGVASADSLARFLLELLHPTLISPELFAEATSPQFDGLSGILPGYGRQTNNQWGLGFSIRGAKNPHWLGNDFSPRAFGHFGQSGSFIWVDPDARQAGLFLGAQSFGNEHLRIWPTLTNEMRAF